MAQTTRQPAGQPSGQPTGQPPTGPGGGERLTAAERRAERAAQARREQQRRQRRTLALALASGLILALAAFLYLRDLQASKIAVITVPDEGGGHVTPGTPLTYNHYPPSSGKHFSESQPPGVYRQEVPEGNCVHSLEHGYIVVLVKCPDGCPDLFTKLEDLYKNGLPKSAFNNVKFIVTPYSHAFTNPSEEAPITLVAWNHQASLQSFDAKKIAWFYRTYVDKGPEQVP